MTTDTSAPAPRGTEVAPRMEDRNLGTIRREAGAAELNPSAHRRRGLVVDNILRWGTPVVLLVAWQLFAMAKILDPQFWPTPLAVAESMVETVRSGYLTSNLGTSLMRFFYGWGIGSVCGIALGVMLGTVRPLRMAIEPLISAIFTVPKLALFPLLLLLFGLGETPKILLIALTVFVVVTISTTTAIIAIPETMKEPLQSFDASRWQMLRHLTVPMVLPDIFNALRITTGMGVLVLVAIEMVQGASGLGYVIWSSWQVYDVERMYVGIVTMSLVGVVLQYLVIWCGQMIMPWRASGKRS